MAKYLNETGLSYFWSKVKPKIEQKANSSDLANVATSGSYNDLQDKITAVTTSSDGLMTSSDKSKLDGFAQASDYALKSDIVNVYKYKGGVNTYAELPTEGLTAGDVYDVKEDGMNYAWTGTAWDNLGGAFTIETISNAEIDKFFE